jgi:hypothetical protein
VPSRRRPSRPFGRRGRGRASRVAPPSPLEGDDREHQDIGRAWFGRDRRRHRRDIARWEIQCKLAEALGVDINAIEKSIHDGTTFARLAADYQDADKMRIEGSPSFVLNEGRQKLYGNVGFRIIEANIRELLRAPAGDQASWC